MPLDYFDLIRHRKTHPSWRLMTADNAPLIISFLDRVFREGNVRQIGESELSMKLEDYLFELRDRLDDDPFPRSAGDYLDEWTTPGREWLRKFYPPDSDVAHFDLTPGTERVFQWIDGFFSTGFVGTESRLKTSLELLKQMVHGAEEDRDLRLKELKAQKKQIDRQIRAVEEGTLDVMDDRQVRERFIQFERIARELLGDFRAVEHHFRELDRDVRERIASWEGEKGDLLEDFFGSQDRISDSEEGQSFRAFWDFLMTPSSQEEISRLLDRVFELPALEDLLDDRRLRRIHYDWMAAGEQTQRTVARLSRQLRRYLDDRAFWENRRIAEILDEAEKRAVELKDDPPAGEFMAVDGYKVSPVLPLEQPLFTPPAVTELVSRIETGDVEEIDTEGLYSLFYVDELRLKENIERALEEASQARLSDILAAAPLEQGLAELITYINMAEKDPRALIFEDEMEYVSWADGGSRERRARYPRTLFNRIEES